MKIHNNNSNNNTIQLRELPNWRNGQLTKEQIEGIKKLQLRLEVRIRQDKIEIRREKYIPQSLAEKKERIWQKTNQ